MAKHDYGSVVGGSAKFAGVDQGIDFTGPGPIYALGNGVVTRVAKGGTGWPGQGALVSYQLTSGPRAGEYVYVAEDLNPNVVVGQKIRKGDEIAEATGSGQAPGIEMGWADKGGRPLAALDPSNKRAPTSYGSDFNDFARGATTAPPSTTPATEAPPAGTTTGASSAGDLIGQDLANAPAAPDAPVVGANVVGLPGTASFQPPQQANYQTWQALSALPGASADTMRLASLAGLNATSS